MITNCIQLLIIIAGKEMFCEFLSLVGSCMCHTSQALQLISGGTKVRCFRSAGMEAVDDQKEILEDRWEKLNIPVLGGKRARRNSPKGLKGLGSFRDKYGPYFIFLYAS